MVFVFTGRIKINLNNIDNINNIKNNIKNNINHKLKCDLIKVNELNEDVEKVETEDVEEVEAEIVVNEEVNKSE